MSQRPFTARCRDAVENSDLPRGPRHLYHVLATYADYTTGECHPSIAKLSAVTATSRNTLRGHRDALVEAGLMTFVLGDGRGNKTVYTLTPDGQERGYATPPIEPVKGAVSEPLFDEERGQLASVKGAVSEPPYKDLEDPIEDPTAARTRGNGPPPSTQPTTGTTPRADTSPDRPAPPPDSKEWLAILAPAHLGMHPAFGDYRAVCETLPTHGSARELLKRYRALRRDRGGQVRGREVVGLAQDIRAEWEEASRPDPQAAILADQDALHRRLGIGRYRDTTNAGEQSPEGDAR